MCVTNQFDNNAGSSADTEQEQINGGFNYWPHPDVVFKFGVEEQFGQKPGNATTVSTWV